jgi:tRNA A-37 threonylcarbamoyl transferase component Bud32
MSKNLANMVGDLSGRQDLHIVRFRDFSPETEVTGVSGFPSRKNRVYRISTEIGELVMKIFQTGRTEQEFSVLREAFDRGLKVPEPYEVFENLLFMEFVSGCSLCDSLNETLDPKYAAELAEWFGEFHESFRDGDISLVKSDSNLRNFLVSKRGIVGVDFEFAHTGNPMEDIGEACAFILDTDPIFTAEKYELCHTFLRVYQEATGADLAGISDSIAHALREAAHFRQNQRDLLLLKATEIAESGEF